MERKYNIQVDKEFDFEWTTEGNDTISIAPVNENTLSIIFNNKVYEVICEAADINSKSFQLKVNGAFHKVTLQDDLDILIREMGMKIVSKRISDNIISPMPGLLRQVNVQVGETLEAGHPVLILEAMKMENILKAAGSGIVKEIHVNPGQTVEKGQLLITIEGI
jgi:biotin carboxyl carrier protein